MIILQFYYKLVYNNILKQRERKNYLYYVLMVDGMVFQDGPGRSRLVVMSWHAAHMYVK